MTRFWRAGHWRTSATGYTHWVAGHWVDRDAWEWQKWDQELWEQGGRWTRDRLDDGIPNAKCPRCAQAVWFYRNPNGGCAYFDELDNPWPRHPCMDSSSLQDRTAVWQAIVVYEQEVGAEEADGPLADVRSAYERWQAARRSILERDWEWDIYQAEAVAEQAMNAVLERSRSSASLHRKRETWTTARLRTAELKEAFRAAKDQEQATREEYLRVLDQIL